VPGQGVRIDYAAIVEILLMHLEAQSKTHTAPSSARMPLTPHEGDEVQQSTSLRWLADFLHIAPEIMVSFTPRLIGVVLPNLAHHVPMIQSTALRTNKLLSTVIRNLPVPETESPMRASTTDKLIANSSRGATSPSGVAGPAALRQSTGTKEAADLNRDLSAESLPEAGASSTKPRSNTLGSEVSKSIAALDITSTAPVVINDPLRSQSPTSLVSMIPVNGPQQTSTQDDQELFDYAATVNALTIQFLSEHEDTRVAALKWLIMLHQKAPNKVVLGSLALFHGLTDCTQMLGMDDGTFPALLKTLSDSSEEVAMPLKLADVS
jgi:vacuole morphology and inheritance protein 14